MEHLVAEFDELSAKIAKAEKLRDTFEAASHAAGVSDDMRAYNKDMANEYARKIVDFQDRRDAVLYMMGHRHPVDLRMIKKFADKRAREKNPLSREDWQKEWDKALVARGGHDKVILGSLMTTTGQEAATKVAHPKPPSWVVVSNRLQRLVDELTDNEASRWANQIMHEGRNAWVIFDRYGQINIMVE